MIKKQLKISLACMGLLLSTNLQASSREGFYLGAGIGGAYDNFDLTTTNAGTGFAVTSPTQKETSWLGSVFAGYGNTFTNGFYLGGEIGTYFPRRSATISSRPGVTIASTTYTNPLHVQDYLTADILPGFRLNEDWLIYGRLGLTYANVSLSQNSTAITIPFDTENKKIGGRIGAGINLSLDTNFALGLDYFYSRYPETTSNFTTYNMQFNQKISSNYVGISAIYTL